MIQSPPKRPRPLFLIDLAEIIELHQLIEGKSPLLVQVDEARNEEVRHAVAFDDAENGLETMPPASGYRICPVTGYRWDPTLFSIVD